MGISRSSFYAAPAEKLRDEAIVAEIRAITDEFERYGYRRVGAELGVARQALLSAYRLATSAASSARLQICIVLMAPWK